MLSPNEPGAGLGPDESAPRQLFRNIRHLLRLRAVVLLSVAVILLSGAILQETDLIASVITFFFLFVVTLSVILTLVFGILAKRLLRLRLFYESSESGSDDGRVVLRSLSPCTLWLHAQGMSPPPLFHFRITLESDQPLEIAAWEVSGSYQQETFLSQPVRFPHRGNWNCHTAAVELQDFFGFSSFQWLAPIEGATQLEVHPPKAPQRSLPLISSSDAPGDEQPSLEARMGEPFDIKPYHPSDGMRKILWKVYAKSGELLSRHPERALTPEGEVAVFAAAGRKEDSVAAAAYEYALCAEREGMELWALAENGSGQKPEVSSSGFLQQLISSAWDEEPKLEENVSNFIHSFETGKQRPLSRMVLFAAGERLSREEERFVALASELEQRGITPFLFGCSPPVSSQKQEAPSVVSRLIFSHPSREEGEGGTEGSISGFSSVCAARGWQFTMV